MSDNPNEPGPQSGSGITDEMLNALMLRFNTQFPKEEDCLEELYSKAVPEHVFRCRYCKSPELNKKYGDRTGSCRQCKQITWFTGGTFFSHIRAARPWLAAIWLMEQGVIISSSRFHKLVGIAQSSALHIFKKITTVAHSHMLETKVTTESTYFTPVFCKRSRETQARQHPLSEQEEMEKRLITQAPHSDTFSKDGETHLAKGTLDKNAIEFFGNEKTLYDILSTEPIHVDAIHHKTRMPINEISAALTMLELAGAAIRLTGDRYVRSTAESSEAKALRTSHTARFHPAPTAEIAETIDAIVSFIRNKFHGISRKCLQNYLAAYWLELTKAQWSCGSLLEWCWQFGPLSYAQTLTYISPLQVSIPTLAC
ncbi:MAG: hypothetical protein K2W82_10405 [Candidatus Obscuribacterales bacterium]|nr:hypothetical protein [Candidatus Obscuribacterales bacterium]